MKMANIFEMKSSSFIINHDGSYITNQEGKRILEDNFFNHLKTGDGMEAEELIKRLKNSMASEDRRQEKFLVDGKECYLFYNPIKYTQWVLVTVVPCQAVDILSQLNAAMLLFIFLLAMLLIIFAGYYYIKNPKSITSVNPFNSNTIQCIFIHLRIIFESSFKNRQYSFL